MKLFSTIDISAEAIIGILAGLILVWQRTDSSALRARILTLLASGGLALALGGDLASFFNVPVAMTYTGTAILGPLIFELAAALIKNPENLVDLYKHFRGNGGAK